MRTMRGLLILGIAGALACGGGQTHPNLFGTDWTDDGGAGVRAVQAKIGGKTAAGADVAVGVAGNNDKIVGLPLGGGAKWSFPHAVDVRPAVAGTVVVGGGAGELFALDAMTGKKLWSRPLGGMVMRGAGDDGKVTVVSLAQSGGQGSMLLAIDRGGSVTRQIETEKAIGVPAVLGGYAFVPWSSQYVSVINLDNGDESARILLRGKVSHAVSIGGGLYFGESETFRFDDKIGEASKGGAAKLTIPQRELPGTPMLRTPGEDRVGPVALAIDKTKIYARPASPDGALTLDSRRFYGTYFRIVMGFDGDKGALAWVWNTKDDLVGGAAGPGSFIACDEEGKITVLDANGGGAVAEMSFGEPIKSCVVQADTFKAGPPKAQVALASQIADALLNRDAEMVSGQKLLLREMSTLEDELATKTLVDLASDPRTAPPLVIDARTALAGRRNGAKYMLDALARHYDFLKDVLLPPPVGPIAQALAAMKEKGGAPLLALHLLDPANSEDDAKQSAAALVDLGDASQLPQLKEFFGLYRASHEGEPMAAAVVSAGQALVKIGGADGRKTVDAALADPMTPDGVKSRLHAILEAMDAQAKQGKSDAKPVDPKAPPPKVDPKAPKK